MLSRWKTSFTQCPVSKHAYWSCSRSVRKTIALLLMAALSFLLIGCDTGPTYTNSQTPTAAEASDDGKLPAFTYKGDNPYIATVCTYLTDRSHIQEAEDGVTIPCPLIYRINDSDKNDVLVWGDFYSCSYTLRNTTMMVGMSYAAQGRMHLQAVDGEYVVTDLEIFGDILDGDHYFSDVIRLCAPNIGLILRCVFTGERQREAAKLDSLRDYAMSNGLNITQYQVHGSAPVAIPGMPATAEEDQIIHWESNLGYSIDYDLRLLSFSGFDTSSEGLWGVEDLSGCSLRVHRYWDQSRESVLALVEQGLIEPVCESAVIGADDIEATLVRDGSLDNGVMKVSYIIPIESEDWLVVSVSNTYFSFPNGQIVSGADTVLLHTLESFKLL